MNYYGIVCFGIAFIAGVCVGFQPRIIGGDSANIEDYPYQVSLRWTYGAPKPMHFCGGSIVDKQHVVTAAHCVDKKTAPGLMGYIRVYTGSSRSDQGRSYDVKKIVVHPGYRGASNSYLNDIAIITLKDSIEFNESQKPIKLPRRDVYSGVSATVTGWGSTNRATQETPANLQKAAMKLLSSSQCQQRLIYTLKNTQVCAVHRDGLGVCTGDSGGPLAVNGELVGIASYVVQCGKTYPDVYTNVYSFTNFIKQNTDVE